jgi:hypothetical protein
MNTPSRSDGNYHWRMPPNSLTIEHAEKLAALAEVTDRLPEPIKTPASDSDEFLA